MKRLVFIASVAVFSTLAQAQTVSVVSFQELEVWMNRQSDTTYVLNFWATWCSPCVEELPHFEAINEKYKNDKLRIILVSLDFNSELKTKVIPFVLKRNLRSTVLLLDEPDANIYIDKISSEWSGAIPATLIFNPKKKRRRFYEKQFSLDELQSVIQPFIERN